MALPGPGNTREVGNRADIRTFVRGQQGGRLDACPGAGQQAWDKSGVHGRVGEDCTRLLQPSVVESRCAGVYGRQVTGRYAGARVGKHQRAPLCSGSGTGPLRPVVVVKVA